MTACPFCSKFCISLHTREGILKTQPLAVKQEVGLHFESESLPSHSSSQIQLLLKPLVSVKPYNSAAELATVVLLPVLQRKKWVSEAQGTE